MVPSVVSSTTCLFCERRRGPRGGVERRRPAAGSGGRGRALAGLRASGRGQGEQPEPDADQRHHAWIQPEMHRSILARRDLTRCRRPRDGRPLRRDGSDGTLPCRLDLSDNARVRRKDLFPMTLSLLARRPWLAGALVLVVRGLRGRPARPGARPPRPRPRPTAAAAPRPITVADVDRIVSVRDPQRSPDGQWVAYSVSTVDVAKDKSDTDIWMVKWDGTRAAAADLDRRVGVLRPLGAPTASGCRSCARTTRRRRRSGR